MPADMYAALQGQDLKAMKILCPTCDDRFEQLRVPIPIKEPVGQSGIPLLRTPTKTFADAVSTPPLSSSTSRLVSPKKNSVTGTDPETSGPTPASVKHSVKAAVKKGVTSKKRRQ